MDTLKKQQRKVALTIGGYELKSIIGEGGLGIVYLARQLSMKRYVALKVLDRKWMNDDEFRKRFLLEARIAGKLSHPNLIQVFDVGYANSSYYFSMEYVPGRNIEEIIVDEGRFELVRAIDITLQVLDALNYIWEKKLVHRDLKPSNIIINSRNIAKLGDFGFVKTKIDQSLNTMEDFVLGTPDYMSPEQAMGREDLDFRSDIYSLGATLYHMTTCSAPFQGSESVVIKQHIESALPSPRSLIPTLSEGFCHVIERMMAKEPEDRYQAYDNLRRDLLLVKEGERPQSRRIDSQKSTIAREGEYFGISISRLYKLEKEVKKLKYQELYYQIIIVVLCILLLLVVLLS